MVGTRIAALVLACASLCLTACGGGDGGSAPQTVTTQIFSDPTYDGDIEETGPGSYVITQGMSPTVQSVLSGIDPLTGNEFRAFLDFPLGGAHGVPGNAIISSAILEIHVDGLTPVTGQLPIRIDLVTFQPPTLLGTDFDRSQQPALASVIVTPDISGADVGGFVRVDVTALMNEAQSRGLADFQVRILEDLGPAIPVLMSIDDSTGANSAAVAPLLTVAYY